jgi:hypothetical protein
VDEDDDLDYNGTDSLLLLVIDAVLLSNLVRVGNDIVEEIQKVRLTSDRWCAMEYYKDLYLSQLCPLFAVVHPVPVLVSSPSDVP